jgi:hypothetical protein
MKRGRAMRFLNRLRDRGAMFSPLFLNRMTPMAQKNAAPKARISPRNVMVVLKISE